VNENNRPPGPLPTVEGPIGPGVDAPGADNPSRPGRLAVDRAGAGLPDEERPTRTRYVVLGWLCVATAIAYIDRGCLSVAEGLIRSDLGLTESQMGLVMSAFFLSYSIFQVPAALVDQRFGSRRALSSFAAAWSLATCLCGVATGFTLLVVARLAMGAAEAGALPSSTAVLGRWFPTSRRATATGILTSFMGVGGAIGALLSGIILASFSWRWMFALYTIPGLVWAAGFALWFRDSPRLHAGVNRAELDLIQSGRSPDSGRARTPMPWRRLMGDRALIGMCLQQFFRAAGAMFYLSWFPTYLRETRGVLIVEAGVLSSMPHWAMMAGCFVGGWLSDVVLRRTKSLRLARQGVSVVSLAVATACIGLAYPVSNAWLAVLVLSIGAFAASMAGPCVYALTIDLGGEHTAQYFGVMNTAGTLGAVLFPMIVPLLVKSSGSWNAVLILFAGLHAAACVSWLLFDADSRTTT
jgi:MFS family permease